MQFEIVLAILGVAVSLGGLLGVFLPRERARTVLLIVVAAFLALTSGLSLHLSHQHRVRVEATQDSIQAELGREMKTFDQLYNSLYHVDVSLANEALDNLVSRKKVGQKILEVQDSQGTKFYVRVYYLNPDAQAD